MLGSGSATGHSWHIERVSTLKPWPWAIPARPCALTATTVTTFNLPRLRNHRSPEQCSRHLRKCHQKEAGDFVQSVHGQAVARGVAGSSLHGLSRYSQHQNAVRAEHRHRYNCRELTHARSVAGSNSDSGIRSREWTRQQLQRQLSPFGLATGIKGSNQLRQLPRSHNILPSSDPRSMVSVNQLRKRVAGVTSAPSNFTNGKIHLTAGLVSEGARHDMESSAPGSCVGSIFP